MLFSKCIIYPWICFGVRWEVRSLYETKHDLDYLCVPPTPIILTPFHYMLLPLKYLGTGPSPPLPSRNHHTPQTCPHLSLEAISPHPNNLESNCSLSPLFSTINISCQLCKSYSHLFLNPLSSFTYIPLSCYLLSIYLETYI